MNRIHTIALFAGVFAVAMGTLGFTGFSSVSAIPLMTAAIPQTQDQAGILGHVTYTLYDATGNVKSYVQGDNVVVEVGRNCIASHIFNQGLDAVKCNGSTSTFDYIAIGNFTGGADAGNQDIELDRLGGSAIGCATSTVSGEMARVRVTPTIQNASASQGAIVVLETLNEEPFTFDNNNNTSVTQSGLFDGDETAEFLPSGSCQTLGDPGTPTTWNMFSIQDISVTTTDGDSLSIKWTITIG